MFEITAIPAFKDNYIWLLRKGRAAILVDPGESGPALAALAQAELNLSAILITHKHADHQGGVAELLSAAADKVAVYGPASESITGLTHPLLGGETIRIEAVGLAFEVLSVPGHTQGHLAYYGDGHLFCGDTLFTGGCGRVFEGTMEEMYASLSRLAALPDDTRVYCAHEYTAANLRFALAVEPGNMALRQRCQEVANRREKGQATVPSTLALEKATNPFLRCAVPEVIAAARVRAASACDPESVFSTLRAWKNDF